jgi:hypothetical protein
MPVPAIAEWEWLNWKFPRPVRAGDTIYARWTLTQKRPPVGGAPTAIVVWRVDVHTADGTLCAEGEVGASVRRHAASVSPRQQPAEAAPTGATPAARRRRRRRPASNGTKPPGDVAAPVVEAPVAAAPAAAAQPERSSGGTRRRRRRRSPGSPPARGKPDQPPAPAQNPAPIPLQVAPAASAPAAANPLSRVIRRLRRP